MGELQPIETFHDRETIEFCQACLIEVASRTCLDCGCPLCNTCYKDHACNKEEDTGHFVN